MQIIIKGKQMDVAPRLRDYMQRKVERLVRLVGAEARIEITVTEEQTRSARDRFSVQFALTGSQHPIHSEVSAANANMAFDKALDKVTAQVGRHKGRHTTAMRHRTTPMKILSLSRAGELSAVEDVAEVAAMTERDEEGSDFYSMDGALEIDATLEMERNEEIWSKVLEIRRMPTPTTPMDDQEVIAQMEELRLPFFPFFNEATNSVNVMYRMENGGYGLLVPEMV